MTPFYPLSSHYFSLIFPSPHITYPIMVTKASKNKSVRISALFTWKPATVYFPFSNLPVKKSPSAQKKKGLALTLRLIIVVVLF
jgi:hypothetical protein